MYDQIIIGSGPAGMAAAIYATRAKLDFIVLEKEYISGGQVINTYEIDNYPAFPAVSGMELAQKMRGHAESLDVRFVKADVLGLTDEREKKIVRTDQGDYEARAVIIAAGARHSKLGIPGEEELAGMGVSYCATCDGAFFAGKTVAVIGGGNAAVEDAIFLARACPKVYLVHRRKELRADKVLQDSLFALGNVEIIWDSVAEEIQGQDVVTGLRIVNRNDGTSRLLEVDGVFAAIGTVPNSGAFRDVVDLDEKGFIKAGEDGKTNVPGILAAGDIRTKELRQIVTAVSDGANAVTSVQQHLMNKKN